MFSAVSQDLSSRSHSSQPDKTIYPDFEDFPDFKFSIRTKNGLTDRGRLPDEAVEHKGFEKKGMKGFGDPKR